MTGWLWPDAQPWAPGSLSHCSHFGTPGKYWLTWGFWRKVDVVYVKRIVCSGLAGTLWEGREAGVSEPWRHGGQLIISPHADRLLSSSVDVGHRPPQSRRRGRQLHWQTHGPLSSFVEQWHGWNTWYETTRLQLRLLLGGNTCQCDCFPYFNCLD